MADGETFEDDLFDDLYADDDPKPAAAPQADEPAPAPAASASAPAADTDYNQQEAQNGADAHMNYEEYDDDDEVDFNLGDTSTNHPRIESPKEQYATPSAMSSSGPPPSRSNANKEDG